jgi:hypothetical protein
VNAAKNILAPCTPSTPQSAATCRRWSSIPTSESTSPGSSLEPSRIPGRLRAEDAAVQVALQARRYGSPYGPELRNLKVFLRLRTHATGIRRRDQIPQNQCILRIRGALQPDSAQRIRDSDSMGSRPPGFCQNQKSWLIDAGEDTEIAFVGGSISIHIPWLLVAGGDRAARAFALSHPSSKPEGRCPRSDSEDN